MTNQSTHRYDFLAADFFSNLNWIPQRRDPRLVAFLYVVIRSVVLTYVVLILYYLAIYAWRNSLNFSASEVFLFSISFVLFEEQARWIFISDADSKLKSSVRFFVYIVIFETMAFYVSSTAELLDYLAIRSWSVMVHAVCGLMSLKFVAAALRVKVPVFFLAVLFHVLMNMLAIPKLVELFS